LAEIEAVVGAENNQPKSGSDSCGNEGDVSQYSVQYEYLLWVRPAKARR